MADFNEYNQWSPALSLGSGFARGLLNSYDRQQNWKMRQKELEENRNFQREMKKEERQFQRELYEDKKAMDMWQSGVQESLPTYVPEIGPIQQDVQQSAEQRGLIDPTTGRAQSGMLAPQQKYELSPRGRFQQNVGLMGQGMKPHPTDVYGMPTWDTESPEYRKSQLGNLLTQARIGGMLQDQNIKGQKVVYESKAEEEADRKFGQIYAEYFTEGAMRDVENDIDRLDEVIAKIEDPDTEASGWQKGLLPKYLRDMAPTEDMGLSAEIEDELMKISSKTIKLLYGGNPSIKEVEMNKQTLWNPRQKENINVAKMKNQKRELINKRDALYDAKKHFEENKTMKGFNFKRLETRGTGTPSTKKSDDLDKKLNSMSDAELEAELKRLKGGQ